MMTIGELYPLKEPPIINYGGRVVDAYIDNIRYFPGEIIPVDRYFVFSDNERARLYCKEQRRNSVSRMKDDLKGMIDPVIDSLMDRYDGLPPIDALVTTSASQYLNREKDKQLQDIFYQRGIELHFYARLHGMSCGDVTLAVQYAKSLLDMRQAQCVLYVGANRRHESIPLVHEDICFLGDGVVTSLIRPITGQFKILGTAAALETKLLRVADRMTYLAILQDKIDTQITGLCARLGLSVHAFKKVIIPNLSDFLGDLYALALEVERDRVYTPPEYKYGHVYECDLFSNIEEWLKEEPGCVRTGDRILLCTVARAAVGAMVLEAGTDL